MGLEPATFNLEGLCAWALDAPRSGARAWRVQLSCRHDGCRARFVSASTKGIGNSPEVLLAPHEPRAQTTHRPYWPGTYLESDMFLRRAEGQGLAEYALILALIAILAITALIFLSGRIDTILSTIGHSL